MMLFKSLAYRSFALLWGGQTVSRFGDSLYRITLAWWVLEQTNSATTMGVLFVFSFTPTFLFLLIAGVAVDRFPRLRIMLASDLLCGVVVIGITFLAFGNYLELWHLYLANILFGSANAFFHPAYTAVIPELIPREALPSANSLTTLSQQVVGIVGPMLGATIAGVGDATSAFALNALSFFISAICLVLLLKRFAPPTIAQPSSGIIHDLHEGITTVFRSPWLRISMPIAALINITLAAPINVTLPFLVKNNLHANINVLGLVYSAFAVGAVCSATFLGRATAVRRRGLLAYGSLIACGLAAIALGLPIGRVGVVLAVFVDGVSLSTFSLVWTITLQELVPSEILGRVSSIAVLAASATLPVGFGVAGWATDQIGAPLVFMIGGILTIGMSLLALIHPAIRCLD